MPEFKLTDTAGVVWTLTATPTSTPPPPEVPPSPVRPATLGTNLAELADWGTEQPFANLFAQSRPWLSAPSDGSTWSDARPLAFDVDGFVTRLAAGQQAKTLLLWGLRPGQFRAGRYVLTWQGIGGFAVSGGGRVVSVTPNRLELEILDGSVVVALTTCGTPYPKGIRLAHVDDGAELLARPFAASLAPFAALRFMDWQRTNGEVDDEGDRHPNPIALPAHMPRASACRFNAPGRGVPLSVALAVAKAANAAPWVCIPHQATDPLVEAMIGDLVGSPGPVFVELSNEVWNGAFLQGAWFEAEGLRLGIPHATPYDARLRYFARRTSEVGAIAHRVLGSRAVVVLGAQAANAWWIGEMLRFSSSSIDAVAIAPYFGGEVLPAAVTSLDALWPKLEASVTLSAKWIEACAVEAKAGGKRLIAYEGGQHLVGVSPLFDEANAHARMGELYTRHLADWRRLAGDLFVHFNDVGPWGKWGRWGATRQIGTPTPKAAALLAFAAG